MNRRYRGYQLLGLVILLFGLALIGLPALLVRGCNWSGVQQSQQQGPLVRLKLARSGQVLTLPLDEYLIGVVAAEMPAEFHPEALKAQAVAARTYTMLRLSAPGSASTPTGGAGSGYPGGWVGTGGAGSGKKPPDADLTDDPGQYQAWIPVAEMRRRWGILRFGYYYGKIAAAVRDTDGEVILYHNRLIDPVYHASCGGLGTEDAADVWGYDVPYLKGVPCTWDPKEQQAPVEVAFAEEDLFQRLGIAEPAVPAGGGLGGLIRILDRTARGRVKDLQVASQTLKATDLRQALGLRATDFTVRITGNQVVFTTRGYGHAVGMCQWGAQGMALQGRSYKEILTYYYHGVQIVKQ